MNSRECHLKVVFQKSKKRKGNGYAFRVTPHSASLRELGLRPRP